MRGQNIFVESQENGLFYYYANLATEFTIAFAIDTLSFSLNNFAGNNFSAHAMSIESGKSAGAER